ncbi:LysR family transcriptional regulator [Streptomyces sp. AM6-12]|uniref:LysR family transcriptional regulator n=1 Tax=Streptomyces sp. AM6-12 TaxID=3345149 RepID=UPI00379EA647
MRRSRVRRPLGRPAPTHSYTTVHGWFTVDAWRSGRRGGVRGGVRGSVVDGPRSRDVSWSKVDSRSSSCRVGWQAARPAKAGLEGDCKVDVQRLETFVAVAQSNTLAEAAERLGYARSTVTSHLQALERALGASLLERGASVNRLTRAGTRFLEYATDILDKLAQAQAAVAAAAEDRPSTLSIGATASLCTYRLPGFLRTLRRLMPNLETQIFVGSVAQLRDQVGRGELAAALVNSSTVSAAAVRQAGGDDRRHLWTDRAVLVGAPESAARPQRLLVTAPGCVYRDIAEREVLPRLGQVPVQQVGSVDGVKSSVLGGMGVGVVPAIAVGPQLESGQLVEMQPSGLSPVMSELIWNAGVTPAHVVPHFQLLRPPGNPQPARSGASCVTSGIAS